MFNYYYNESINTLIRTSSNSHSIIKFYDDGSIDIETNEGEYNKNLTGFQRFEHDEFIIFIKSKYKYDINLKILDLEDRIIKLKRQLLNIDNNDFSHI